MTHQTIEGFGATTSSLAFGPTDDVPAALRTQAIDAAYNQVRLNMGNLEVGPFESPASALYSPANDDSDPNTFNASGFNWTQSDNMHRLVVAPASTGVADAGGARDAGELDAACGAPQVVCGGRCVDTARTLETAADAARPRHVAAGRPA